MKPAVEDIEMRTVAWEALSTLFLDTDVSLLRQYRAERLAGTPYSIPELEEILVEEVFPVCSWNLFSIAGEWAGFDPQWLSEAILKRNARRFKLRLGFGHKTVLWGREWKRTKEAICALREKASHA